MFKLGSCHFSDQKNRNVHINRIPDQCPVCHHAMSPNNITAYCDPNKGVAPETLQIVYECPRSACKNLFIAYFKPRNNNFEQFDFQRAKPQTHKTREFSETIQGISPMFCTIYNQALLAEQEDLVEICGVGYRKALEFLIKDYLCRSHPDKEEEIKKKKLGKCIKDDLQSPNVVAAAKRAVWLGNDETHYLRKWEGKDLQDLKKLVDLVVHWMEMEKLTEEITTDMPDEEN